MLHSDSQSVTAQATDNHDHTVSKENGRGRNNEVKKEMIRLYRSGLQSDTQIKEAS